MMLSKKKKMSVQNVLMSIIHLRRLYYRWWMTAIAVIGTLAAGIVVNAVLVSRQETGATGTRVLHVDAGDVHIVVDGSPTAPTMVLIHGTAGSTAWWDKVA